MEETILIYLTDDIATLYKSGGDPLFTGSWRESLRFLDTLSLPVSLLIDLSHVYIREDKLPSLFLWDRVRLLHHKRTEVSENGDLMGAHIFKEENERYLRTVHLQNKDSFAPFLLKAEHRVFFVALEAYSFLKEREAPYQILIYPLSDSKVRHIIFKGKRLLLSRIASFEEDLNSSLHYLSRTHPDIFEMFHVKHLENVWPLLASIASQKKPLYSFPQKVYTYSWVGRVGIAITLCLMIFEVYRGVSFENKALHLLSYIESLKTQVGTLKEDKNRIVLDHYLHLKSVDPHFLKSIEDLSCILEKHQVRLVDLEWKKGKELDLTITFLIQDNLHEQLDPVLLSLESAFPQSRLQLIESPYHSSPHEVFRGKTTDLPLCHIKLVMQ